jgi:hypothetical protein
MDPDILIVRNADGYRLVHGHLHLANLLDKHTKVVIDVKGEGSVTVARTREGVLVNNGIERFQLRQI